MRGARRLTSGADNKRFPRDNDFRNGSLPPKVLDEEVDIVADYIISQRLCVAWGRRPTTRAVGRGTELKVKVSEKQTPNMPSWVQWAPLRSAPQRLKTGSFNKRLVCSTRYQAERFHELVRVPGRTSRP